MLKDKTIVLGITGSIAAYKAVDLASKLTQAGAKVDVVMTKSATEFVSPLTFRSLTGREVVTEMFTLASEFSVEHVALAERANLVLIAPATANVIAKIAAGIADDMLCCTVLAAKAPVVIAPAMNVNMYENSITQDNLAKLRSRGFTIVSPAFGRLASGRIGRGRLAENEDILGTVSHAIVFARIEATFVSAEYLKDGKPAFDKLSPLLWFQSRQDYVGIGKVVGKSFSIGKELKAYKPK